MGCCRNLTFSDSFLSVTGQFTATSLWLVYMQSLISCAKVRVVIFRYSRNILKGASWTINHYFPPENLPLLPHFLWPLVFSFFFWALDFSLNLHSSSSLVHTSPQMAQSPSAPVDGPMCWHTETVKKKPMSWLNSIERRTKIVMPVQILQVLYFSGHYPWACLFLV